MHATICSFGSNVVKLDRWTPVSFHLISGSSWTGMLTYFPEFVNSSTSSVVSVSTRRMRWSDDFIVRSFLLEAAYDLRLVRLTYPSFVTETITVSLGTV